MPATLAHFPVRRLLALSLTFFLLPAVAQAGTAVDATVFDIAGERVAPPVDAQPDVARFPVRGQREWGRGLSSGHDGIDLLAKCGTPMVTPEGGRVVHVKSEGSAGNYLVVRSPRGEDHVFMHLEKPAKANVGDRLEAGERIGAVGDTGNASTCHLHYEIWTAPGWYEGGKPRDPRAPLERWAGS